jgi:signal transduction histidine kinase
VTGWIRTGFSCCGRGLVQAALSVPAGVPLLVACVLSVVLIPAGLGLAAAPAALLGLRGLAGRQRDWARDWSGVAIADPYRPRPAPARFWVARGVQRVRWLLTDPATWRDLLWLVLNMPAALVLGLVPAIMTAYGLGVAVIGPLIRLDVQDASLFWPFGSGLPVAAGMAVGAVVAGFGLGLARVLLRAHALFTQSLLAPTRLTLARRVRRLTETRSQVVDASAAELRRIERDLHDGPQARLAAVGLNIGLAKEMVRADPDRALALLDEARQSSGEALSELRALVRGIHPPVLAERGLHGAVRALALTLPLPVDVRSSLAGRAGQPVEAAAYFAVAESLANVVKHAGASRAWVTMDHGQGRLRMTVGDDGSGGAGQPGGGLQGIERRLAAFDGTLDVASPAGGPTVLTMELPCELSSPRISPSFGTG